MLRLLAVGAALILVAQSSAPAGRLVTSEGQTLSIVQGGEFLMGAPEGEPGRTDAETPHHVRIPRAFAVATTEVTVSQFARFLSARPEFADTWRKAAYARFKEPFKYIPTPDSPQTSVSWYDAARYCNWLSERDGIPKNQWVRQVWEWTMDRRLAYPSSGVTVDVEDSVLRVRDDVARTRRGGSFTYEWFTARSAHRGDVSYFPQQIRDSVGFRIGRTLP